MVKVTLPDQDIAKTSARPLIEDQGFSTNDLVEVSASTGLRGSVNMTMKSMVVINTGLGQGVPDQECFIQHPTGL